MGTIIIEEWIDVGQPDGGNRPIFKNQVKVTVDATTSTSDETLVLDKKTRYVSVTSPEAHRISMTAATTGSKYAHINANERRDLATVTTIGSTISYRTDA